MTKIMNNLLYDSKKYINYDFLDNNNLDLKNKNKNYFPFLTTINNLDAYSQNDSFLFYDKNNFELSSKDSGDNNSTIKKEIEINNSIINKTNNNINKNKKIVNDSKGDVILAMKTKRLEIPKQITPTESRTKQNLALLLKK